MEMENLAQDDIERYFKRTHTFKRDETKTELIKVKKVHDINKRKKVVICSWVINPFGRFSICFNLGLSL